MTRRTQEVDRRTALEAFATSIAASTAGCLDGLVGDTTPEPSPTDTPTETSTETPSPTPTETPSPTATPVDPPATPEYLDWAFAPGLMNFEWPIGPYTLSPATVSDYLDRMNSRAAGFINDLMLFPLAATQLGHRKVNQLIGTRDVYVMLGNFTQRKVDEARDERFERKPPEYRGFLLYENEAKGEAIGAKDGVVVVTEHAGQSIGPMGVLKRLIDTSLGEYDRLVEERPQVEPLASWIGDGTLTDFSTHQPYLDQKPIGKIGSGISLQFNESGVDARYVLQFDDPSLATDNAVDAWFENVIFPDNWTDTTRAHYGSIVVVEGEVTYDKMFSANF